MWIVDFMERFIPVSKKKRYGSSQVIYGDVKNETHLKALAIYTATSYIASGISKCEFKVYENFKEVKNQDYFTLNLSPNLNETSTQFWYKVVEKMYYDKEALVIESKGNLYCADSFTTEEFPMLGNKYKTIKIGTETLDKVYKAEEVFLFKLENDDVVSLIDDLYNSLGLMFSHAIEEYKKANSEKYKLKISQVKAGDEEFNKEFEEIIKLQLKTFLENPKAVYPEFDGYELSAINTSSAKNDSKDIIELKKAIFETVSQAFKMPKSLLDGNITNLNEVVKAFITFAIDPVAATIEEELSRKQGYSKWAKGNFTKVDTSTINHIDIFDIAENTDKFIASGTLCVDEVRELIDRAPLNNEFSKTHFITKNYQTAQDSLKGGEKNE
ncbi:MAG: phage portal protein [Sarcina sp.]